MEPHLNLYEYVIACLKAKEIPQKQVAAESGVPFSTVCKIAQGAVSDPSVHTIQKLYDYFAVRRTNGASPRSYPSPLPESGPGAKPESLNAVPASTGVPDQTAACPCQAGARKTAEGDAVAGVVHVGLQSGDTIPAYACAPAARRGV